MKTLTALLFLALTFTASAREPAHVRLYCLSVLMEKGQGQSGYSLEVTSSASSVNRELMPDPGQYSHFAWLNLEDFIDISQGAMALDVPFSADLNHNGFPDFFEVSQSVSVNTSGAYDIDFYGGGSIQATWQRNAGSHVGTCYLKLNGIDTFAHTFTILEYTGPLAYTNTSQLVIGTVTLSLTGSPTTQLQGSVEFERSSTNRFNELTLKAGTWTNAVPQDMPYASEIVTRDPRLGTNYYSYFDFMDGEPSTPDPDFLVWVLSIDDLNDSNGNGIPDFSDDPTIVMNQPKVTLSLTSTNVLLSVSGADLDKTCVIQSRSALGSGQWETLGSLKVTNNPVVVPLAFPPTGIGFWQVKIQ